MIQMNLEWMFNAVPNYQETEESYETVNFFSKLSQLTFVKLVSFEEDSK